MNTIRRLMLALAASTLASSAFAQAWPAKPIRLVVPFPPGGGTDTIAREVSQRVAAATGWTFVIDNRSGAGGNLGVDAVAKSAPDGHTLVLEQTSNLAINPTLYARMPYDPQKDLAPVVVLAQSALVMVTGMGTPHKSVADVVAAAKARPGQLNFASPGNGTVAHLTSELFQKAAGIDNGKLRALAVTSARRVDDLPSVATINESGFKGFDAVTWFGLLAPAGTPRDVVARLNAEFNKALQNPELRRRLGDEGADAVGGTPEQFAALIRDEIPRWGRVVRESGARVD